MPRSWMQGLLTTVMMFSLNVVPETVNFNLHDSAMGVVVESFRDISKDIIGRLDAYHKQNERYAGSDGQACFSDIGLKVEEWEGKARDGIVYAPKGDQLEVFPAKEYTFFVNDVSGVTRILSYNIHWRLIYNLRDQQWYFHRIAPEQLIDIESLHVKKDKPYNPQEYQK